MADINIRTNTELDQEFIRNDFVDALDSMLLFADVITPGVYPGNEGNQYKWILDADLTGATTTNAIDGGTTNDIGLGGGVVGQSAAVLPLDINEAAYAPGELISTMKKYGSFVPIDVKDIDFMPTSTLENLSARVRRSGRQTLDTLVRAEADGSGTTFDPALGAGTTTVLDITVGIALATDIMTAAFAIQAVNALEQNNAVPFSNGMYRMIINTTAKGHLETEAGLATNEVTWSKVNKHVSGMTGQEKIIKGIIGGLGGGAFSHTTEVATDTSTTADSFANLGFADEGMGGVHMNDMEPEVFINRAGSDQVFDPYRITGTVSFRFRFIPQLLRSESVVKFRAATGS